MGLLDALNIVNTVATTVNSTVGAVQHGWNAATNFFQGNFGGALNETGAAARDAIKATENGAKIVGTVTGQPEITLAADAAQAVTDNTGITSGNNQPLPFDDVAQAGQQANNAGVTPVAPDEPAPAVPNVATGGPEIAM